MAMAPISPQAQGTGRSGRAMRHDLIAGISVAGLLLPEAVAYAAIAGLPPERAIFAGIAGGLAYAAFGRSRFAIISSTSSAAAILAAILAAMPVNATEKGAIATIVVVLVGLILIIASAARLGALTDFVSRPVLRGFAFGLGITIATLQLPTLLRLPVEGGGPLRILAELLPGLPHAHLLSGTIGAIALAALLLLRRFPAIPGPFVVLAASIAASMTLDFAGHGIAVVGPISFALEQPRLPALDWNGYSRLAQLALPLVVILLAESWGTIRTLALRHGDAVDGNRELGSLGFANLASALVQGMPVGAGFSAGSANEAAGATSRRAGATAAIGLAILILLGAPLIAYLPKPVLAAVVITALAHALDLRPILRLWALRRDALIATTAAAAVVLLGIVNGMLVAVGLSVAAVLQRLASPHIARLGRIGPHDYVDRLRHPDALSPPGMAIWRPASPLFFANADRTLGLIVKASAADPTIKGIVVSLEESIDFDSTAMDALIEFDAAMRTRAITVRYARVHDQIRDLMIASDAEPLARRSHFSVDDAVMALAPTLENQESP